MIDRRPRLDGYSRLTREALPAKAGAAGSCDTTGDALLRRLDRQGLDPRRFRRAFAAATAPDAA